MGQQLKSIAEIMTEPAFETITVRMTAQAKSFLQYMANGSGTDVPGLLSMLVDQEIQSPRRPVVAPESLTPEQIAEKSAEPQDQPRKQTPLVEYAEDLRSRIGQITAAQITETAVPIGPDRWLVAVVIDGHTKDNLQNICHRTGRNVSQRIALLINRAADTRKRHQ
jgi:hypothetical protein